MHMMPPFSHVSAYLYHLYLKPALKECGREVRSQRYHIAPRITLSNIRFQM